MAQGNGFGFAFLHDFLRLVQAAKPDKEECNKCDLTVGRVSGLPFVMIHPGGLLLVVSYALAVLILLLQVSWEEKVNN